MEVVCDQRLDRRAILVDIGSIARAYDRNRIVFHICPFDRPEKSSRRAYGFRMPSIAAGVSRATTYAQRRNRRPALFDHLVSGCG
jgi:hypothetical protein